MFCSHKKSRHLYDVWIFLCPVHRTEPIGFDHPVILRNRAAAVLHTAGFGFRPKQLPRWHEGGFAAGVFPYSFVQPKENAQGHGGGFAAEVPPGNSIQAKQASRRHGASAAGGVFPYSLISLLIHRVPKYRAAQLLFHSVFISGPPLRVRISASSASGIFHTEFTRICLPPARFPVIMKTRGEEE